MKFACDSVIKQGRARGIYLLLAIVSSLACRAEDGLAAHYPTKALHAQPLTFEPYEDGFAARTPSYTVLLEPRGVTIALRGRTTQANTGAFVKRGEGPTLSLRLIQSNLASAGLPKAPLVAKSNYFIGNDPAKWRTSVPLFGKVCFPSVYKNVDLVYYGNQQGLEYDFVVHPGGEPGAIRFSVNGDSQPRIARNGDLVLEAGGTEARLQRPSAYQIVDGQRREVTSSFRSLGGSRFGIRVARYDRTSALIIDPVLAYSTYLGGSDDEGIFGIAFDDDGDIYVAGETSSLNFPHKGGVQDHLGGNYDVFVSKFDPRGARQIYSTYLGGANYDHAIGVRVDKQGNAYVAGVTQSSIFPVKNAWQAALAGTSNGFVAKLSPSGSRLVFSTYLGGQGSDEILALAIDRTDAVYVTGFTNSLNFPTTAIAFEKQCDNGAHSGFCEGDAFVAKFDSSGRSLVYSTYLGGAGFDIAQGLAVNEAGEAYVVGQTSSSDFPTRDPYQSSLKGPANVFITALNEVGSDLRVSTYLGGSGFDGATDVALDRRGNVYVTGETSSPDFPTFHAFQATYKGGFGDGFLTKFNPEASQLVYSTYYGGSGFDYPIRVTVNADEEAALTGFTSSTDFPLKHGLTPAFNGGTSDAFVVRLDRYGEKPSFSTYVGGTGDDFGYAVIYGCRDSLWVGGSTSSTNFPLVGAFQPHYGGGPFDAFLSQISNGDGTEESTEKVGGCHQDREN